VEVKLARTQLDMKPESITLEEIEKKVTEKNGEIFYFDRENSHKTLIELTEYFEDRDKSVYFREVKFGYDEDDYVYEVHIL
jgi:hypothetical protein